MPASEVSREQTSGRVRDGGAATVWVLAAGLLTILIGAVGSAVGAAVAARHRAQSAADLAALAGAAHAVEGETASCTRASQIAAENDAWLVGCKLDGWDLIVTAKVVPAGVATFAGNATASARAGPVEPGWTTR